MLVGDIPDAFSVRLSTVENAITIEQMAEVYGVTPHSLAAAMKSHVKGWVCTDAEKIVGFAMGDHSNGEIQVDAVLPEYERKGIGRALLAQAQNWLFSNGFDEVWLLANPDPTLRAYTFYRWLGWKTTGEIRGDDEVMILRKD